MWFTCVAAICTRLSRFRSMAALLTVRHIPHSLAAVYEGQSAATIGVCRSASMREKPQETVATAERAGLLVPSRERFRGMFLCEDDICGPAVRPSSSCGEGYS